MSWPIRFEGFNQIVSIGAVTLYICPGTLILLNARKFQYF